MSACQHTHPALDSMMMEGQGGRAKATYSGSHSPPKSLWRRMLEGVKRVLRRVVSLKIRVWISDYCKHNGLLTLSVLAVVSGCVIGYMLRSFNLSSQVC